jgi:peptidoglycan/xylan/chitin deacetylase (PgdA/CDA1 family)
MLSRLATPVRPLLDKYLGSITHVQTQASDFVLTYDDGPEPGSTEQVLMALAEHGATATFFVLVGRARREPGLLKEVAAAGHEIGLHGIDHRRITSFSPAQVYRRTRDGRAELEDLLGQRLRWFRPPYGEQDLRRWAAVRRAGLHTVLWGPDLLDWTDIPTEDRVASGLLGAEPGVVVLGHDGFAGLGDGVDDGPRPEFDRAELTRRVLGCYADRGLQAKCLGQVLAHGRPGRRAQFRH